MLTLTVLAAILSALLRAWRLGKENRRKGERTLPAVRKRTPPERRGGKGR